MDWAQYFNVIPKEVGRSTRAAIRSFKKWPKDRRGRKLSFDDLIHMPVSRRITEGTMRLMEEIDRAIPGWPMG